MSDFLTRLAARAVGRPAVAAPRVPSVYEAPVAPGGATADLEVVDEEVVVGMPAPPSAPSERIAGLAERRPDPVVAREPRSKEAGPHPAATPALRGPPAIEAPPVASQSRESERARVNESPGVAEAAAPAGPMAPVVVALPERIAVPAAPPVALAALPRPPGDASPEVRIGATDTPAVRVHIGRIEVRADLPAAPVAPPRSDVGRYEGLSLGEYLQGKREAR